MRDVPVSRSPARGGGPWKTNSCSACSPREGSIRTCSHGSESALCQWKAVVRKVGGVPGRSLSGTSANVARANSRILPRSTSRTNGAPVAPSALLSTIRCRPSGVLAADGDDFPGHVRRVVAGEEHDDVRHLPWLGGPTERLFRRQLGQHLFRPPPWKGGGGGDARRG